MIKREVGVMLKKNGRGWGIIFDDGITEPEYGWVDPDVAAIFSRESVKKPEDITYPGDHNMNEIKSGELYEVVRTTHITVEYLT